MNMGVLDEKTQITDPTSWMTAVTVIENLMPNRCMTSIPGYARSMPAMENTPIIWLSISTPIPRSEPIN